MFDAVGDTEFRVRWDVDTRRVWGVEMASPLVRRRERVQATLTAVPKSCSRRDLRKFTPKIEFRLLVSSIDPVEHKAQFSAKLIDDQGNPLTADREVRVGYETVAGTALPGVHFVSATGTLIFASGQTEKVIEISLLESGASQGKSFHVRLLNPINCGFTGDGDFTEVSTGGLPNFAPPPVTVSIERITTAEIEEGVAAQFRATLSDVAEQRVTVHVASTQTQQTGTGQAVDFDPVDFDLVFEPGETTKMIFVRTVDDVRGEALESFELTLSSAVNAQIGVAVATQNIAESDVPLIHIQGTTVTEGSDANADFNVFLSNPTDRDVTVHAVTNIYGFHPADPGIDFGVLNALLTFPAEGTTRQLIQVPVLGDTRGEYEEQFVVSLVSPTNAEIAPSGNAVATIVDDDTPFVSVDSAIVDETDATVDVAIRLTNSSDKSIDVYWHTADGTALAGENDYVATGGVLTFSPGQTTRTVSITLGPDDSLDDGDKVFYVVIGAAANAEFGAGSDGTVEIRNDEYTAWLTTESDPFGVVGDVFEIQEGKIGDLYVFLTHAAHEDVTLTLTPAAVSDQPASSADYSLSQTSVTILEGETSATVNLTAVYNEEFEQTEALKVTLSGGSHAIIPAAGKERLIQILDFRTYVDEPVSPPEALSQVVEVADEFALDAQIAAYGIQLLAYLNANHTKTPQAAEEGDVVQYVDIYNIVAVQQELPGQYRYAIDAYNIEEEQWCVNQADLDAFRQEFDDLLAQYEIDPNDPDVHFEQLAFPGAYQLTAEVVPERATWNQDDYPTYDTVWSISGPLETVSETDADGTLDRTHDLTFTVTRSVSGDYPAGAVDWEVDFGTADEEDLNGPAGTATLFGTLEFEADEPSKTITIPIYDDRDWDPDETFRIKLSANAALGLAETYHDVVIKDDEPTLTINDVKIDEDEAIAEFTITLNHAVDYAIIVRYSTQDGTATVLDQDYTPTTLGSVTIPSGNLSATIQVPVTADRRPELTETLAVNLTEAWFADSWDGENGGYTDAVAILKPTGVATLVNDDKPRFAVSDAKALESPPIDPETGVPNEDGAWMAFEVTLIDRLFWDVTLDWQIHDGDAENGVDYSGGDRSLTFSESDVSGTTKTIWVEVLPDEDAEGDEWFYYTVTGRNDGARFFPTNFVDDDLNGEPDDEGSTSFNTVGTIYDDDGTEDGKGACMECSCAAICKRSASESVNQATGEVENKVRVGIGGPGDSTANEFIHPSLHNPNAVVTLDLEVPSDVEMFKVELTLLSGSFDADGQLTGGGLPYDEWLGLGKQTAYYSTDGFAGDKMRINMKVDTEAKLSDGTPLPISTGGYLPTGIYRWRAVITGITGFDENEDPIVGGGRTTSGSVTIVNDLDSPIGNRWLLDGLDRLVIPAAAQLAAALGGDVEGRAGDILHISGDNTALVFRNLGDGNYQSPAGQFATLTRVDDGAGVVNYVLEGKYGSRDVYDAQGYLVQRSDRNGNVTEYAYEVTELLPGLGELFARKRLTAITDSLDRVTTFTYVDSHLDKVTDPYGRVSTFEFTDGYLTKIVTATTDDPSNPDPNAPAPQEYQFIYDARGRIRDRIDPSGRKTTFTYNASNRVETISRKDAAGNLIVPDQHFAPADMNGYANPMDPAIPGGSIDNPALGIAVGSRSATSTVGAGADARTTSLKLDRFGNPTQIDDAAGGSTALQRDKNGLVTKSAYDPDGAGPRGVESTYAEYDARGNLTKQFYSDGSYETWAYDTSAALLRYDVVLEHRDRFGRVTTYTYDARGNVLTETVHGATPATDVVTSYAYTSGTGGLPRGLLLAVTDFAGTTAYDYYTTAAGAASAGKVKSVTTGAGTADAAATFYQYDAFGRLSRITGPDPDDGGPLTAPITLYRYDELDRPTDVVQVVGGVDGEGNSESDDLVTHTDYDPITGQVWKVTSPTPAGGVPYVVEYTYNAAGQVETMTERRGAASAVTTYHYDAFGNLDRETGPDPDGAGPAAAPVTLYGYDVLNRLTKVTQVIGADDSQSSEHDDILTERTYDPATGLVAAETDPLGTITRYTYDAFGRVLVVTTAAGTVDQAVTRYEYQADGSYDVIDPLGNRTHFALDPLGRAGGTTDALNRSTGTTYDNANRVTSTTDAGGRQSTVDQYDPRGNVLQVTSPDPDGGGLQSAPVTQFEYDKLGRKTAEIDANQHRTEYRYDALGNLQAVVQAVGTEDEITTSYTYDALGRVLAVTDPDGYVTQTVYDDEARTITTTAAFGTAEVRTTVVQLDALGRTASVTEALGTDLQRTTALTYDEAGRVLTQTVATGTADALTTKYGYDRAGNVTSVTTADGTAQAAVTTFQYDALSRRVQTTDALGNVARQIFDPAGDLLSAVDPLGRRTATAYDALLRPTSSTDSLGQTTVYHYDAKGRLDTVTSPSPASSGNSAGEGGGEGAGIVTKYEYDDLDRVTAVTEAYGTTAAERTEYTYDAVGNRLTQTDAAGNLTVWTYDALNRRKSETITIDVAGVPTEATRTWHYNGRGLVDSYVDRNGRTTTYQYDALGRKTHENFAQDGVTYTYDWDALNRVTRFGSLAPAGGEGGGEGLTYAYQYNLRDQVTHIAMTSTDGLDVVLDMTYDPAGRRDSLSATVNGVAQLTNASTYDLLNRLESLVQTAADAPVRQVAWTYDAVGDVTSIARSTAAVAGAVRSDFSYDAVGRLVALSHQQNGGIIDAYSWTYDALNRLTSRSSVEDGLTTYQYDESGQLLTVDRTGTAEDEAYTYDAAGNRTSAGANDGYVVGLDNRLLSDGEYAYQYDAEGNRTVKQSLSTGEREETVWDQHNRPVEIVFTDAGGNLTKRIVQGFDFFDHLIKRETYVRVGDAWQLQTTERDVYDGSQVLLELDGNGAVQTSYLIGNGQVVGQHRAGHDAEWLITDHQGSVRQVVDAQGVVLSRYAYDAYGNQTLVAGDDRTKIGFTGLRRNDHLRAWEAEWRIYDPRIGQWIKQDPIGLAGGYADLDQYVGNAPTYKIDPSGLAEQPYEIVPGGNNANEVALYNNNPGGTFSWFNPPTQDFVGHYDSTRGVIRRNGVELSETDVLGELGSNRNASDWNDFFKNHPNKIGTGGDPNRFANLRAEVLNDREWRNRLSDLKNNARELQDTVKAAFIPEPTDLLMGGAAAAGYEFVKQAGKWAIKCKRTGQIVPSQMAKEIINKLKGAPTQLPTAASATRGWKVGDPINNLTAKGNVPSWNAVRSRYWKNEAHFNSANYDATNLDRMGRGLAPQRVNPRTGQLESMELHHTPPQRDGGLFDVQPVWPDDHALVDPFRHTGR